MVIFSITIKGAQPYAISRATITQKNNPIIGNPDPFRNEKIPNYPATPQAGLQQKYIVEH
jgi:hypothetical protein